MPIHDWTRVPAGLFHHFHQDWTIEIARALNRGRLPKGVAALVEQRAAPREADVLAIERQDEAPAHGTGRRRRRPATSRGADRPPHQGDLFRRASRIVVKHHLGRIIAVIEIVSAGNKDSRAALRDFVEKTIDFLQAGIHVLIVDLFPPTPRDPFGIHKVVWDEFVEEDFAFPPGKDRILASYETGLDRTAYVEPVAVGDAMPDMPLFLTNDLHVLTPLEATYQATWDASPEEMRVAVETGVMPEPEEE